MCVNVCVFKCCLSVCTFLSVFCSRYCRQCVCMRVRIQCPSIHPEPRCIDLLLQLVNCCCQCLLKLIKLRLNWHVCTGSLLYCTQEGREDRGGGQSVSLPVTAPANEAAAADDDDATLQWRCLFEHLTRLPLIQFKHCCALLCQFYLPVCLSAFNSGFSIIISCCCCFSHSDRTLSLRLLPSAGDTT